MARSYDQFCPIARTLDLVGERWTLLILRDMLVFGKTRFSEFQESLPGIPARVLSDRLKRLTDLGFVTRRVYSEHPLRAGYHLTAKGETLRPVLGAIAQWGMDELLTEGERKVVLDHIPSGLLH
jgi:DNA-binding HxlR family transcriptional regulator